MSDLAGQLWRQVLQVDGRFAVICKPHQVSVDEDGEIVASIVAGSSVADEGCRRKFRGCPCKAIQRSWHRERAVGVEDLCMLGHRPFHTGVTGDVSDQHRLVVQQVLPKPCVEPSVVEVLKPGVFRPVIWEVHKDGLLDVIFQVATFLDFSKPVVKGSRLGEVPEWLTK